MCFSVAPKVTLRQCSFPVVEGENVTLECNATGNPVPSIGWIMESTGEVVSINNILILSNINANASGVYQCIAMNNIGNDTKNCTVNVYRKFTRCSYVAVTYVSLEISAREISALAVQYTFKTYILINIRDIYLIHVLTKIGKKKMPSAYI